MNLKVIIPKRHHKTLNSFLSLNSDIKKLIKEFLKELNPLSFSLKKEIQEFVKINNLKYDEIIEIIEFFRILYYNYYSSDLKIDDFVNDILLDKEKELIEKNKEIFKEILSFEDTLGIISKGDYLSEVLGNKFLNTLLITDLRPIYYEDPLKHPEYFIINHNLKIVYFTENRKIKEFSYNLKKEDIKNLIKKLERALKKEKSLKEICRKKKLNIIENESNY